MHLPIPLAALLSSLLLLIPLFNTNLVYADQDEATHNEIGRLNNQSLLWGPYRPNLYFGVRPRLPKSLMAGFLWAKVEDFAGVQNGFRYTCEQNEDMAGYGWDEYDARRGGVQTIHDVANMIDMTTTFVKIPGGDHGGSWAARIKGQPRDDAPSDLKTTVMFMISSEPLSDLLNPEDKGEALGYDGDVTFKGSSADLGDYKLVITKGQGDHPPTSEHPLSADRDPSKTTVQSMVLPEEFLWQAKSIVFRQLSSGVEEMVKKYGRDDVPPPYMAYQLANRPDSGNAHIVQKVFQGAFEFDVIFSSASAGKDVTSEDVTQQAKSASEAFGSQFSRALEPQAPFKDEKYREFGSSMISNLAGGIGYFYGKHKVDRSYDEAYDEDDEGFWEETERARAQRREEMDGPHELFSSIPSRPFFPRGFLWDEGFHLMPIMEWDTDLSLEIIHSWYKLMDEDGWIAREQILGDEARSKVPDEFQVQYPHYANPPTLFLTVEGFLDKLSTTSGKERTDKGTGLDTAHLDNPELGLQYLRDIYPLLQRQFYWFKKTQFGDIKSYDREAFSKKEGYRWRGRTVQHILTSGLDDYPRAQPPHPGELHVDLISWVGLMAKVLSRIAVAVDLPDDVEQYQTILTGIEHNLVDLHWSEKDGCFCDATIDEFEEHALVCHKGYISLFPFLTGLLKPDDPKLGKTLDLLGDESELFSPHGIRSLSKKDVYYGTAENYWRGPVWMPINYLAVMQLHGIATQKGPYQTKARELYSQLRSNLVDTVYESWKETGFAWEQYHPDTGKGQRTQHFTGWTALVVKIMAMEDLSGGGGAADDSKSRVKDEL